MARHPKQPPAIPNLPPAGHARDEELRRRTDQLEQQGEEQFANATPIDPSALEEDHDAQVAIRAAGIVHDEPLRDGNEVEGAEPGYVYCWAREDKPGEQVRWKLAKKVRMPDGSMAPLWEVVQGDMPEFQGTRGIIDARGYRKSVDCILLRARADRYRQYQIEMAELNHLRMHGTSEGFEDLARRSRGKIQVYSEADISNRTTLDKAMAAGMARSAFTKKLREGTAHRL